MTPTAIDVMHYRGFAGMVAMLWFTVALLGCERQDESTLATQEGKIPDHEVRDEKAARSDEKTSSESERGDVRADFSCPPETELLQLSGRTIPPEGEEPAVRWMCFSEQARPRGRAVEVAADGQLVKEWHYDNNGKRHGIQREWYYDGVLKEAIRFVHGVRDGVNKRWSPEGNLVYEGQYEGGEAQGLWVHWYYNGRMRARGRYEDGKEEGVWEFWHKNGNKKMEGVYENGEKVGTWNYWNEKGEPISEEEYEASLSR